MADYEDVYAPDLAEETTSTLSGTEQFVMFDSVEGKRGSVNNVGSYILQNGDADGEGHTVAEMIEAAVPRMTKEVTGNPITVDDALGGVQSLTVELTPIQEGSGTPSPQNVRPITGHDSVTASVAGKNLLNPSLDAFTLTSSYRTQNNVVPAGVTARLTFEDKDTTVSISGIYLGFCYEELGYQQPARIYRWAIDSGSMQSNTTNVAEYGGDNVICSNIFVYPKTDEAWQTLTARYNIMVEIGTTATAYVPYKGKQTTTVTLPSTVYGGTVGVVDGVGQRTMVAVDLGTLTYKANTGRMLAQDLSPIAKNIGVGPVPNAMCERYYPTNWTNVSIDTTDGSFGITGNQIIIADSNYSDPAVYKEAMSGVYVVYETDEPIPLSSTPTDITLYNGDNVVSSDGDMDMVYVRDIVKVIEKLEG